MYCNYSKPFLLLRDYQAFRNSKSRMNRIQWHLSNYEVNELSSRYPFCFLHPSIHFWQGWSEILLRLDLSSPGRKQMIQRSVEPRTSSRFCHVRVRNRSGEEKKIVRGWNDRPLCLQHAPLQWARGTSTGLHTTFGIPFHVRYQFNFRISFFFFFSLPHTLCPTILSLSRFHCPRFYYPRLLPMDTL